MAVQYNFPPTPATPADARAALLEARRRWGPQAAVRIEDAGCGLTVFRPRYRVGNVKGTLSGKFFIEHGAGDDFPKALADAILQEWRP